MTRGKLVLSPFPYTDLSGQKVRPGLIVSRADRSDNDVIIAFLTSHKSREPLTDLLIDDSDPDFPLTGLKATSIVRLDKLVTIDKSVLLGELGELSPALLHQADERLKFALELT